MAHFLVQWSCSVLLWFWMPYLTSHRLMDTLYYIASDVAAWLTASDKCHMLLEQLGFMANGLK